MSCWTLWQRMPPRYQLTMRDIRTEDQDPPQASPGTSSRASSATPHSPRIRPSRTSRPAGGSAKVRRSGEPAMLTSGVLPEEESFTALDFSVQNPVLPPRSSAYIHNMKNQMRINSARRRLNEGTLELTSPTTLSYTPKARATTAPAFPITDPSNTDQYHRLTSPALAHPQGSSSGDEGGTSPRHGGGGGGGGGPPQRPQRGFSGRKTPQRPSSGYGVAGRRHVPVRTLCPFAQMPEVASLREENDDGSLLFQRRRSSPTHQDCVIGNYQVAALYVDNGRVTFFRKTKPDMTQSVYSAISPYNVTREDGSYLSHLRKAYLSGVRDLPKVVRKDPDLEKHNTIRERMDYDRKVGRILDYYSQVDIPTGMQTPLSPAPQRSYRISSSRRSPRFNAMTESRDASSKITNTEFPDQHNPGGAGFVNSRGPEQGQLGPISEGGGFLRINAKARLHHRHQFYLRTPASPSHPPGSDAEKSPGCVCGMCRLEMEVALMAQLHQDLGVSVDAATAARIRSSLEQGAMTTDPSQMPQSRTMTGGGRDHCPAGPTCVSDARRSGAPSEAPESVSPRPKPTTLASQQPASSPSVPTATEKAVVVETTSLTVTLPAIEEVSDTAHAIQENEASNPNHPAPDQSADTIKQTLPAGNVEQEATNISTDGQTVKNSQQTLPDIENSVENQELASDTPTDRDSAQTSEQEGSGTITDRSVNKETDTTNTDENSVKNSDHDIKDNVEDFVKNSEQDTPETPNEKDSMKNSEKEAFDIPSDTDSTTEAGQKTSTTSDAENVPSNTEHKTSDTAPADDSTARKQQMSSAENKPEPGTDFTEAGDKQLHSDTGENEPQHSDSVSDPNPSADVKEDMTGKSNAAELSDTPNNRSAEQGSCTVQNHGGGKDTESSANAQTNDNDYENDGRTHSDDQSLDNDLSSDVQATSEGTSPVLMKATEQPIANSTLETTPGEEQSRKPKEAVCDSTVEAGPPKIVISSASDNEDNVPNEENVISSASDNEDNVPNEETKASFT